MPAGGGAVSGVRWAGFGRADPSDVAVLCDGKKARKFVAHLSSDPWLVYAVTADSMPSTHSHTAAPSRTRCARARRAGTARVGLPYRNAAIAAVPVRLSPNC